MDKLPPADATRMLREQMDRRDALRALDFNDPWVVKMRSGGVGALKLLHLQLLRYQPETTEQEADEVFFAIGVAAAQKAAAAAAGKSQGNVVAAPEAGLPAFASGPTGMKSTASSCTAGPG